MYTLLGLCGCATGNVGQTPGGSGSIARVAGGVPAVSVKNDVSVKDDQFTYIDNGVIRVGVDLTRGGAIGYLAASGDPDNNVINCHDMGREVQMSFYAAPTVYNPPTADYPKGACDHLFQDQPWPWNPIGAGDVDGNHGQILSLSNPTTNSVHVVTRPLQWACHNVSCECTFEQLITLDGTPSGTGVQVTATLHSSRSDTYTPAPMDQELPAVYSIAPLYRIVTYNGTQPWTGGDTVEFAPQWPGFRFSGTENWAALVNTDGWGLGVVNRDTTSFNGAFSGTPGSGGPTSSSTGYIVCMHNVGACALLFACSRHLHCCCCCCFSVSVSVSTSICSIFTVFTIPCQRLHLPLSLPTGPRGAARVGAFADVLLHLPPRPRRRRHHSQLREPSCAALATKQRHPVVAVVLLRSTLPQLGSSAVVVLQNSMES